MSTDFIDDGVIESSGRGSGSESAGMGLDQRKEEIAGKVADTAEEIELLRLRQAELESAKKHLEEVNRKQEEYSQGKKELIESLSRNLVLMEKEEIRGSRMVELLSSSRTSFKKLLSEIREIREEEWNEKNFEEELDRALALLESARMEYNQAIAKIDAESWAKVQPKGLSTELSGSQLDELGFAFWLKLGVAFSLPIIFVIMALFAAYVWLGGLG